NGHKTIVDAQQKEHPLAKRSDRPYLKVIDFAAVHFTGAGPDNPSRLGAMRLDLVAVAVRVEDIHAPLTKRPKLLPAIFNVIAKRFHPFLSALVLLYG